MLNDPPAAPHDPPRRGASAQYWQERRESSTRSAPASEADVRAWLCSLVESADDATASQDLDGRITHWSDAAERLLGFSARESVGTSAMRISTLSGRNPARALAACLSSGQPVDPHATRLVHKEGWICLVLLRTLPRRDATGEICAHCTSSEISVNAAAPGRCWSIWCALIRSSDLRLVAITERGSQTCWCKFRMEARRARTALSPLSATVW